MSYLRNKNTAKDQERSSHGIEIRFLKNQRKAPKPSLKKNKMQQKNQGNIVPWNRNTFFKNQGKFVLWN
jgi:hypothetical protein